MTEAEAIAERAEAERLTAEINRLSRQIDRAITENNELQAELAALIRNVEILTKNTAAMGAEVNRAAESLEGRIQDAEISTSELFALIDDLANSYYLFKNLSTASKNVTQYTDEYFTRFKFFHWPGHAYLLGRDHAEEGGGGLSRQHGVLAGLWDHGSDAVGQ